LRSYAASDAFAPSGSLQPDELKKLFRARGTIATASSSHPSFPPANAIDGDPTTLWHSDWRDASVTFPITLTIDLQLPTAVAGIRLRNRPANQNGRVKEFQIEISRDGERWQTLDQPATLPDSGALTPVGFPDPREIRAIRLTARSSHNGQPMASLAEIEIIPADPEDVRDLGIIPGFND
jgi:hypothetical protein